MFVTSHKTVFCVAHCSTAAARELGAVTSRLLDWPGVLIRSYCIETGNLPHKTFNQSVDSAIAPAIFNHMVELQTSQLDSIFHALGDATRRQMLRELVEGERTVSQLAEPFAISLAAASKHIKALESAGLIRREVRGRTHLCRLEPEALASAHEWLSFYEQFWTERLDLLDRLLREENARDATRHSESPERKHEAPNRKQGDDK